MRSSRGVNIDAVTRVSKVGLRRHLMSKNSEGEKDNKATSNIVGEHLKAKANTVAEIRNMASSGSLYFKFGSLDFEKIQDWINEGLCISPVRSDYLGCQFCGQDGSFLELGSYKNIKSHFEEGPLHQPIALPFAPPDKDTEILEKLVRQELLYDDNSHRWVVSKGTSTSSRNSRQSLPLLYFGIDIQRWLIAIVDVLIHSHGCRSQWPYSVKVLRTVPGQIVGHSPSYLGKKKPRVVFSIKCYQYVSTIIKVNWVTNGT